MGVGGCAWVRVCKICTQSSGSVSILLSIYYLETCFPIESNSVQDAQFFHWHYLDLYHPDYCN